MREYLLVLYPAFLNKKIRKDNYPKRSQKIIGTLAQMSFRDTEELKTEFHISDIQKNKENRL